MNTGSSSIKSLIILSVVIIAIGIFIYFCLDLFEITKKPESLLEDGLSSSVPLTENAIKPAIVDEDADSLESPGTQLDVFEEHSDSSDVTQGRDRIQPAELYCIHGQVVMKDGSSLPQKLKITCQTKEPPFAFDPISPSRRDFTSMSNISSSYSSKKKASSKDTPMPTAQIDDKGIFLLKGLVDSELYLQPVHPFLRPYNVKLVRPSLLQESDKVTAHPEVTLILEEGGIVEGRVQKPGGEPADSASVTMGGQINPFFMFADKKGIISSHTVTSNEEGYFKFEQVPANTRLTLNAALDGFAPTENVSIKVKAGDSIDVQLELQPSCSISGYVVDESGGAVPDISISLSQSSINLMNLKDVEPKKTKTDEEGDFCFNNLPSGKYNLQIRESGYTSGTIKDIDLTTGKDVENLKLVLNLGLSISGEISDGEGKPVSNARIKASKELSVFAINELIEESSRNIRCRSDGDGKFVLSGLTEGSYEIEVSARGYSAFKQKSITAGTTGLSVVLHEGGVISGIVISAADGEPVQYYTIHYNQTEGAEKSMMDPFGLKNKSRQTIRDEKGKFSISGLMPGGYELTFKAEGFSVQIIENLTLEFGESLQGIIVALPLESSISGQVLDSITKEPIEGASVSQKSGIMGMITDYIDGETVYSDEYGFFRVGMLSAGKVRFVVNHTKYEEASIEDIYLAEGENLEGIEVQLSRGSTIQGYVFGAANKPVPGANILVSTVTASMFKSAETNEDGYYEINGLSRGNYTVQKMPNTFDLSNDGDNMLNNLYKELQIKTVKIKEVDIYECNFTQSSGEEEGTEVTGVVRENGVPRKGVIVQLMKGGLKDSFGTPLTAGTKKDGVYSFSNVEPGDYTLFISNISESSGSSYSTIKYEIKVPKKSKFNFDIDLPSATLSGRLVDKYNLSPLQSTRILLLNAETQEYDDFISELMGSRVAEVYTDTEGEFIIKNLQEGVYHLRAGGANMIGMDSGGYAVQTVENIHLRKSEHKDNIVIKLIKGGNLEGSVADSKGNPITDASIYMRGPGQASYESFSECKTDATGFYRYLGLAPGSWSVMVKHPDFAPKEQHKIWIELSKSTTLNITLNQ